MAPQNRPQLTHHPERPHANTALDAASVEAVARRVVELIRSDGGSSIARGLVDAATLAAELGVERSWVYAHRDELGADALARLEAEGVVILDGEYVRASACARRMDSLGLVSI